MCSIPVIMKKFVSFLLLCFSLNLVAQDKVFTVMAVQGTVAHGSKSVNIGSQLAADAVLTVNEGSYVGLLHKSGNSVEFKTKGTYELKAQHDKLAAKTKGFQQKYMDYVVSGVTAKNQGGAYQKNMKVTGSVDRALAKIDILIPLPTKVVLINEKFQLEWLDEVKSQSYTVLITNMKEEPVAKVESAGNSAEVDLSGIVLETEQYYLTTVSSQAGKRKSNVVNFYIPSATEKKQLLQDLESITSSLDLNTSVGLVAYGQLCEDRKLMLEALQAYRKAKDLSPDIDYFKTTYRNFMDEMVAQL